MGDLLVWIDCEMTGLDLGRDVLVEVAALRERALQLCLEQASAYKFRSIAANNAWYEEQLRRIAARGKKASGLYQVLLGQEHQTRSLIDAQLTIDESNCYISYA